MSTNIKFGKNNIPFVYKGDKLVYPNPIKDGLLLWYDFKGMRNTDTHKEVAKDLSGNGNDGTLTNFNFTEGSGYKDNTLVFDGVDDSLTIPELVLDETAMTVMHDGKLYVYEDDKVLTVGEDGEIIEGGKNLLPAFNSEKWNNRQNNFVLSPYHLQSAEGREYPVLSTIQIDVKPYTDYTVLANTDLGRVRILGNSETLMGYTSGEFLRVFNTGENTSIELELGVFSGDMNKEINFYHTLLCKGEFKEVNFSPAPEDFLTKNYSPSVIKNLQIYNRVLTPEEIAHNYAIEKYNVVEGEI